MPAVPRAILFDLLTALIDSWSLWAEVAGKRAGRRWRETYLRNTYTMMEYRPYEELVREAAVEIGLEPDVADRLIARYAKLEPWSEAAEVLGCLAGRVPLAVVTNCSEALGQLAARRVGIAFDAVVTAERAGYYKPHPRPYRLALAALGAAPETSLFVAGSAYDLIGASAIGMAVFWHDRIGMRPPCDAPLPLFHHATLDPLRQIVGC